MRMMPLTYAFFSASTSPNRPVGRKISTRTRMENATTSLRWNGMPSRGGPTASSTPRDRPPSMAPGMLRSLLVDGVIAGVGGVVIFVPQIALLFLFLAVLEDCGYMARAAFLVDRVMSLFGLSGKSFLPLMSSFACAVPGLSLIHISEPTRQ